MAEPSSLCTLVSFAVQIDWMVGMLAIDASDYSSKCFLFVREKDLDVSLKTLTDPDPQIRPHPLSVISHTRLYCVFDPP